MTGKDRLEALIMGFMGGLVGMLTVLGIMYGVAFSDKAQYEKPETYDSDTNVYEGDPWLRDGYYQRRVALIKAASTDEEAEYDRKEKLFTELEARLFYELYQREGKRWRVSAILRVCEKPKIAEAILTDASDIANWLIDILLAETDKNPALLAALDTLETEMQLQRFIRGTASWNVPYLWAYEEAVKTFMDEAAEKAICNFALEESAELLANRVKE